MQKKGILMAQVYEYKKLKEEQVGFAQRISYSLLKCQHIYVHIGLILAQLTITMVSKKCYFCFNP